MLYIELAHCATSTLIIQSNHSEKCVSFYLCLAVVISAAAAAAAIFACAVNFIDDHNL